MNCQNPQDTEKCFRTYVPLDQDLEPTSPSTGKARLRRTFVFSGHRRRSMDSKDRQDLGSEKEGAMLKKGTLIATLALLVVAALAGSASALTPGEFKQIIQSLATIPYNPRPIATETSDVTGISEDDTRAAFLSAFTRVEIPAP